MSNLQETLQESLKGLGGTPTEPFQIDVTKSAMYTACVKIVEELQAWGEHHDTYTDTMKTFHTDIIEALQLTMSYHGGKIYVSFILPKEE